MLSARYSLLFCGIAALSAILCSCDKPADDGADIRSSSNGESVPLAKTWPEVRWKTMPANYVTPSADMPADEIWLGSASPASFLGRDMAYKPMEYSGFTHRKDAEFKMRLPDGGIIKLKSKQTSVQAYQGIACKVSVMLDKDATFASSVNTLESVVQAHPSLQSAEVNQKLEGWKSTIGGDEKGGAFSHSLEGGAKLIMVISKTSKGHIPMLTFNMEKHAMGKLLQNAAETWVIAPARELKLVPGSGNAMGLHPKGHRLLVGQTMALQQIDLQNFNLTDTIKRTDGKVISANSQVIFSPDGARIHVLGRSGHQELNAALEPVGELTPSKPELTRLMPDASGQLVEDEQGLALRDLDGALIRRLEVSAGASLVGDISPDGSKAVISPSKGVHAIYDLNTGKQRVELVGSEILTAASFSPDGKRVAGSAYLSSEGIMVWDAKTGAVVRSIPAQGPKNLCISPCGRLAVGCARSTYTGLLAVYELETGKPIAELGYVLEPYESIAFTPDGSTILAVANYGKMLYAWDLSSLHH